MIVDDHPLMRRGFAEVISDQSRLELCAEAASAADALKTVKTAKPDLMIVDICLPDTSGLELIKRISATRESPRILVASIHDETLFAERCLRAGAMGYINKAEPAEKVVEAIFRVLEGEVYLSTDMTGRLLKGVVSGPHAIESSPIDKLTDREIEVFDLIGRGLTTREISAKLHVSIKTVETHREHIKTKLELESAVELTRHAVQWVLENG